MDKYSFRVFWSEEDEGYIAVSPEFPKTSGFGETAEEALAELRVVLEATIELYQEEGWPLPTPQVHEGYSGQFRVRVPKGMHANLAATAAQQNVSLNTLIVQYAAAGLGAQPLFASVQQMFQELLRRLAHVHAMSAHLTFSGSS